MKVKIRRKIQEIIMWLCEKFDVYRVKVSPGKYNDIITIERSIYLAGKK